MSYVLRFESGTGNRRRILRRFAAGQKGPTGEQNAIDLDLRIRINQLYGFDIGESSELLAPVGPGQRGELH